MLLQVLEIRLLRDPEYFSCQFLEHMAPKSAPEVTILLASLQRQELVQFLNCKIWNYDKEKLGRIQSHGWRGRVRCLVSYNKKCHEQSQLTDESNCQKGHFIFILVGIIFC